MSVLSYLVGDRFVIRVVKNLFTNPDRKWANSYEFVAVAAGGTAELLALATVLVEFEQAIHLTQVDFDRVLISTWSEDSVPYDPSTFISTTVTAAGLRNGGLNQIIPLGMAYAVTRQVASGRFGRLFYRGALTEADIEAPAGTPILSGPGTQALELSDAITDSGLDDFILPSGLGGTLALAMISADGTNVRQVTALAAQGVSIISQDHAWFNRTTGP